MPPPPPVSLGVGWGLIHLRVLDRDPGCLLGSPPPPAHTLPGHCSGLYRPTLLPNTCGKSELTLLGYESLAPLPPAAASASSVPAWQDRTIASSRLRLLEYSAFMEVQRDPDTVMWGRWGAWPLIQHPARGPRACRLTPVRPSPQYSKHLFVHIGQTNPAFSDPPLEAVDVRQIYDKFPEKKGGLKELYEKGPPNAFFLVKFWVRPTLLTQDGQLAQLPAHPPPFVGPRAGPAGLWVGGMEAWGLGAGKQVAARRP